jgi:hypothetical protein
MKLETRINVERRIVRRVVRALLAADYEITVDNGDDDYEIPWSRDFKVVNAALFATDEEHLLVRKTVGADLKNSFVFLVYGNDGWDVICDYGLSLDPIIEPIQDWIDNNPLNR